MLQYILKRTAHALFVMWSVVTAVFLGLRFLPGNPARNALGIRASDTAVANLSAELGLNQPIHVQYVSWLMDLLTLDLGQSITTEQQVSVLIARAAPKTLSIGLLAIVIGLTIAIPAGIISATRRREPIDYVATITSFLGITMPAFFVGILLVLVFGVWLDALPAFGYVPPSESITGWLSHILLPAIAVGLPYSAIVMRITRSSLLEALNEPYMQTARAKGVPSRVRLVKHALQNAMIPVVTVAGIQVAIILIGSVTVEIVFGINGLGRLLVDFMLSHDYPVVQATIVLVAGVMVFMNLLVDIAYVFIDPRIRLEGEQ